MVRWAAYLIQGCLQCAWGDGSGLVVRTRDEGFFRPTHGHLELFTGQVSVQHMPLRNVHVENVEGGEGHEHVTDGVPDCLVDHFRTCLSES